MRAIRSLMVMSTILACAAGVATGASYQGSLSVGGGGLVGTGAWNNPATEIEWRVDDVTTPGLWHYEYEVTVGCRGDISHIIFELSPGLSAADILNAQTDPPNWIKHASVKTYDPGGSNPLMPGPLFGIKYDAKYDRKHVTVEFDVARDPVWGDVYAKSGRPGGEWATFHNTGFLDPDPMLPPWSLDVDDHILRPDTDYGSIIPEPVFAGVISLFAAGVVAWRRLRKR